ncbi:MAG: T9SS type A sorting domain-containing protein, partial [bacterium]|nr:T9SS type A sorting domain-containing protein [bacterium]
KNPTNTNRIIVAWKKTPTANENLTIPVNSTTNIQYNDRNGNKLGNLTPNNGHVTVNLTDDSPIYIFDHSRSQEYNIENPPSITTPSHNTSFTHISHPITIKGVANATTKIYLYKAGMKVANVTSDGSGNFSFEKITLTKGGNGFQVAEEGGSISDLYNYIYLGDRFNEETTYKDECGKINIPDSTFDKSIYPEMKKAENETEVINASKLSYPMSKGSITKIIIKDFQGSEITTLNKQIKITIKYLDSNNDGVVDDISEHSVRENDLKVVKLEGSQWKYYANPIIDTIKNEATFSTSKLSIFALAEIVTTLSLIKTYPNPCNLNEIKHITFGPIPYNANQIKIFNIAGELIYTLTEGKGFELNTNTAKWYCINESGKTISSGVYIFYLETEDGKYQRGKFVIIK